MLISLGGDEILIAPPLLPVFCTKWQELKLIVSKSAFEVISIAPGLL